MYKNFNLNVIKFHNYHHVNLRLMVKKLTKHIFAPKLHTRPPWCHREFYACKIALWKKNDKKDLQGRRRGEVKHSKEKQIWHHICIVENAIFKHQVNDVTGFMPRLFPAYINVQRKFYLTIDQGCRNKGAKGQLPYQHF